MVSVMSVNIAAPSPIISELGVTTQCFKGSVVIETCSLWLVCSMSMADFTLSNGFTINPALDGVGSDYHGGSNYHFLTLSKDMIQCSSTMSSFKQCVIII